MMSESDINRPNNLPSTKVTPLSMNSGGKNSINKQFNEMNTKMALMQTNATESKRFDPLPPPPVTKSIVLRDGVVVDGFVSHHPVPVSLAVVGALLFVYGLVAK